MHTRYRAAMNAGPMVRRMRMRIRMLSAAPLLLAAACATAPAERQEGTVAGPAISEATLKTATQILSSDAFEGRAPTTAGEEKSVRYLAEQFE